MIKKYAILCIILTCFGFLSYSQNSLYIGGVRHDVGQYYEILFGHSVSENGKNVLSAGLKINDAINYPDNFVRIGDIYPKSLSENFGLKLQYQYFFRAKNFAVRPYIFTSIEYTKCTARSNVIGLYNLDSLINPNPLSKYYYGREDFAGPYNWFDTRVGIGLHADLSEHFYLNFFASAGYRRATGLDTYIDTFIIAYPSSGLSISGGLGIGYKFK